MTTPPIETSRLNMRLVQETDANEIFDGWATDPDVTKFMRWNVHESIDVTMEWIARTRQTSDCDATYDWIFVCKATGELCGSGGIFYNNTKGMMEMGYCLRKSHWGRGLATEAAMAMLNFAVNTLGKKELFICHAIDNPASGKVIEKL